MTILPKAIYMFNTIPIKLPMAFFTELEQKIFIICMETEKISNSQSKLKKEKWSRRKSGSLTSDYSTKLSHQDNVVLAQKQKYRPMEQTGKLRDKATHLIYDKGGKNIQWRKDSLFNKQCWENWTAICKRMK